MEEVSKFLSDYDRTYMDRTKPKGPDFLIIDNFAETFGIEKADLLGARSEAEDIKEAACNNLVAKAYARCDYLVKLENWESQRHFLPSFNKIAQAMTSFRPMLN